MWRLESVGCQLVLEGLQHCLANCSLRELVPQDDSSWGEALLVGVVCGQDLVKARVVSTSHASQWSQVRLYWYIDLIVYDPVAETVKISTLLKGVPAKVCYHFCDTAFSAIVICNKSGCSSLDHLNLIGVCVGGWCPGCSGIFQYRADKRLVGSSLCSFLSYITGTIKLWSLHQGVWFWNIEEKNKNKTKTKKKNLLAVSLTKWGVL